MIPLLFVFSHDTIFAGVKQESSHLGVRRTDGEGNNMFEQVVLDEAYPEKFRELFFDAQAELLPVVSAYLKEVPVETESLGWENHDRERDFSLLLLLPPDFIVALSKAIDSKMRQFLVSFILYRWLELKLPQEAGTYMEHAGSLLADIKSLLEKRKAPLRRKGRLF